MMRLSPLTLLLFPLLATPAEPVPLPGTKALTTDGDIAMQLVDGVDRFLLREIEKSTERRAAHWKRDLRSPDAYSKSLEPQRKRLAAILGVSDARVPFDALELIATTKQPALVGESKDYTIQAVRWPAVGGIHGEGLLLTPTAKTPVATVIAIPDADQTPEQLCGLVEGTPKEAQYARRLAENGCRVVVPALVSRERQKRNNRAEMTHREFVYRPAFEMGRHLIGYELQKVLALVDLYNKNSNLGVAGWGEGGMLALHAGALDPRIKSVLVSGYFDDRNDVWQEPIDRNVFGLLAQFGDAELASMVTPRTLVIEAAKGPEVTIPPNLGGAPGRLLSPKPERVQREVDRARELIRGLKGDHPITLVTHGSKQDAPGRSNALAAFARDLNGRVELAGDGALPKSHLGKYDPAARLKRQMDEMDRHTQHLLEESHKSRARFMEKLDTRSLAAYEKSAADYRETFAKDVIGRFDYPLSKPEPRTRRLYDKEKWTGYEVVLDVYPDVIAHGVLLLPKGIKKGEKRPVVVCQHGLEGRPKDTIEGDHPAYHDFAAKLAERGFITFAPQNLYLGKDRFRTLQRKANPLGKTLFSVITPQHQQIINWLKTLPEVDADRIGFYGLSYGGKTAMRVPALLTDYCLSICSADFNEWVWKNASTSSPYSYVWTMEYEIFEFDLGHTFNYAEMAALIAPRPFMVERGHLDGVAPDEKVAHEYAKVRNLYQLRLKIPERTTIEWFPGPHTINGKGTFDFLHTHLKWPKPEQVKQP